MSYRDFDEFLMRLEQDDHVEFVDGSSRDPVASRPGPMPVAVHVDPESGARIVRHAFATRRRAAWALQVDRTAEVVARLDRLLDLSTPHTFSSSMERAADIMSSLRIVPSVRRRSNSDLRIVDIDAFQRIVDTTDKPLAGTVFPARDDRPYWGVHVTSVNAANAVLIHSASRLNAGERVAVALGGDPAALIAAFLPLPSSVHRSYFTGWLRKRPVETMRLSDPAVEFPANVDGVLVGVIERVTADREGCESPERPRYAAVLVLDEVRLKPNPVFVSLSAADVAVLRDMMAALSLPLIRLAVPEMRAVCVHGGVARIEVDGDDGAALRSAYTFLASPFTDDVRWIVTCSVSKDAAGRSMLPDVSVVQRKAIVAHPDHGTEVAVFVEGQRTLESTDSAAWVADYEMAVSAWRDAGDRMED